MMIKKILILATVWTLALSLGTTLFKNLPAYAATAADWNAGRIIDDALFMDRNAMTVDQIQAFLNSKVGNGGYDSVPGECDSSGARNAQPYSNSTRAQYAASLGRPTTFTCLNGYYEVPKLNPGPGIPANNYGGAPIPAGAKSAAQLIWDAAQRYNISPKVLLVTIQKESAGPLTTDDWPFQKQYTYAMGAYCPDSGPGGSANCNPDYAGFSIQISESAALKRYYLDNMDQPWWPYKKLGNNEILYQNAKPECGSSVVNITTRATAALYTYTPYQPNQAALNNTYGTGDACSAYGNRNFWRIYNDWFGSTYLTNAPGCQEATNTARSCIWYLVSPTGRPFYTASVPIRDYLLRDAGYQYQMRSFFGNVIALPGNIPVYRLESPSGSSLITADKSEYDGLSKAGWAPMGIDFWADPVGSNSGYPVYRLYSSLNGAHRWATDGAEVTSLVNSGYSNEGIAFTAISPFRQEVAPPAGKLLTFRFNIPQTNSHLWTTDIYERDSMIYKGYQYEGVAWQSEASSTQQPVLRLYAPSIQKHLYTTDISEKASLLASGGWNDEGTAFYVSKAPTASPVYRLYTPKLGVHHLTLDANERAVLISSSNWNDEGVAWYQR